MMGMRLQPPLDLLLDLLHSRLRQACAVANWTTTTARSR
jgi:hypothetical protein